MTHPTPPNNEGDKRHKESMSIQPADWDNNARVFMSEVRDLLKPLADEGTEIDSGGGDKNADLWITSGGRNYYISIEDKTK